MPIVATPVHAGWALSPGTAQDDKGTTFIQYQTIESLADYLLVDSSEVGLRHYRKANEISTPRLFQQASDDVELSSSGIPLPSRLETSSA